VPGIRVWRQPVVDASSPELYQSTDGVLQGSERLGRRPTNIVARCCEAAMTVRAAWVLAALVAAATPAAAEFSMQQDAFVRGFNNFAQANGKSSRLTLKITDTGKVGKFVYDLHGCAIVTGLSKDTNQVIDTLLMTATPCTLPARVDDFVLLAKYLASLALQGSSLRTADDTITQTFKIADKTRKRQTITVGQLKMEIEFSEVIGWVMRVQ
jgi:hypothetical protein